MKFHSRAPLPALLVLLALGSASCDGVGAGAASSRGPTATSEADRRFAACLRRAGARPVRTRRDLQFVRGTTTEGEGADAVINGLIAVNGRDIQLEWESVDSSRRWRVFSRSRERQTDSPDYEGMWQRVLQASPTMSVIAVKRTGTPASFTAAQRCVSR